MTDKKILIVEDQAVSSMTIEENLISLGYIVSDIVDMAENVIQSIEKNLPDLILMDVYLKGKMTGVEIAEIVFEKFNIPIIYLTATDNSSAFRNSENTQMFKFITKPFTLDNFRTTIEITLCKHAIENDL